MIPSASREKISAAVAVTSPSTCGCDLAVPLRQSIDEGIRYANLPRGVRRDLLAGDKTTANHRGTPGTPLRLKNVNRVFQMFQGSLPYPDIPYLAISDGYLRQVNTSLCRIHHGPGGPVPLEPLGRLPEPTAGRVTSPENQVAHQVRENCPEFPLIFLQYWPVGCKIKNNLPDNVCPLGFNCGIACILENEQAKQTIT